MIKKVGRDKKNFWCVFIHWKNLSQEVRTALDKGEAVTIVYDEPWYWKMTKSNSPMPVRRAPPKMTIGGGSVPTTPPSSPTSGWVDAGDAMKTPLRSTNPTPTTPPSPPKLNRQRSCKVPRYPSGQWTPPRCLARRRCCPISPLQMGLPGPPALQATLL